VWYDAATGGSVVADPTLSAVGSVTYYAEAVADGTDCSSLTRTAVTLTIEPAPDAPVSSGDITECEEDPIQTLDANDAITVAAGTTVVWYDAATGGSVVTDPTLSAVGSVTYYAEAVADGTDCSSLTRTAVTLTIEPAPDAPVSSGDITECEEDPIQTLNANDAITVAAGTTVVWYDAATGGSVVADPTLSAVGSVTYYAEAVADGTDCSSLIRTAVTLTIEPAPDAPVSSGDITECEEDPIQTLDANDAITIAAGTTVVWYDAATGGSVVADPTLSAVGSVTYYAEAVADGTDCSSLTRTAVTLTIEPAPDAPVSSGDITECEEDPIQTLDANDAITVAAGTTVVWYDAATGGSVVADPTLSAVGSVTYYAEAVADGTDCSSLTRTAVTLTIEPAPDAPVSSGDITECEEDPIQTLNANDAITVVAGTEIVWYDAATGGSIVDNPILDTVGTVTYYAEAVDKVTGCTSLSRTAVTLTILAAPDAPVSSGDITECEEDPIQTLDANDAITVGAGESVVWYDAATGGTVVADPTLSTVGSVTYYAETVDDATGCTSLERTAVTLTIQPAPDAPVSSGDITECALDPIQILNANDAITIAAGTEVVWYDAATGGAVVDNPILNAIGSVTYYVESVDKETGCTSNSRTAVTLTINDCNIALLKEGVFVDGNGSGCADEGELIEYTFTIVNTGNVPLSDVVLLDPFLGGEIPGPDSGDDNGNGLLDPDEVWIYTATYAVTLDDLNNGFVINQAEVFANGPDGLEVSDLSDPVNLDADDPTETELCQEAQFSLEKIGVFNDENGDGQPQVGETITYTFIVTNTGTVTIFGLTIEDPLPGLEVTGGPIDLPPGAVDDTTFTATYTLTEEDIENGEVRNQAFGVGTDGNGNEVRDDSDDPNDPTDDDNNGDGEPDDVTVTVLPDVLGVEFEIFNGVTPDGDGLNDFFRVLGIENFPDNNMQIFNRWGVLVYETDGYGGSDGETNVFRGRSEGRVTVRESKLLPTGTYYYVLRRFVDGETLTNSGYLYVNRK
jgi:gliding motility-associated-like protein